MKRFRVQPGSLGSVLFVFFFETSFLNKTSQENETLLSIALRDESISEWNYYTEVEERKRKRERWNN